jgi:putative sterol carrier protein
MSEMIDQAVEELNRKTGGGFDGSAKFVVNGEGTIMLDGEGARAADEPSDVTLTADAETFREIFEGGLDPTSAFMTGRLKIDGDMGQAMKLASTL